MAVVIVMLAGAGVAGQNTPPAGEPAETLRRVGQYVEAYFTRVQSVVGLETVVVQPMERNLSSRGQSRRFVHELRLTTTPSDAGGPPIVMLLRELLTVNGRPPKPKDQPRCTDPKETTEEPLTDLLPSRQSEFVFKWAGTARIDRRPVVMIDYRPSVVNPPDVTWKKDDYGDCVSVEADGQTRARIWVDQGSGEVWRLDEHLSGMIEFDVPSSHQRRGAEPTIALERSDTSVKYRPVSFDDPPETLLLPSSIDELSFWRSAGAPAMMTTRRIANYKRFLTAGRIVREP